MRDQNDFSLLVYFKSKMNFKLFWGDCRIGKMKQNKTENPP